MADFQYIWAIVTGVLGILTMIPLTVRYVNGQLPTKKLRPMFELLGDASSLLLSCTEEGLVYGRKAQNYESKLAQLRSHAEDARLQATTAKTTYEDVKNWWKGLTHTINEICMNVRDVRADISSNSLRERERLEAQRCAGATGVANGEQEPDDGLPSASTSSASAALSEDATSVVPQAFVDTGIPALSNMALLRSSPNSSLETLVTSPTPSSITTTQTTTPLVRQCHSDRRCSISRRSSSSPSAKNVRLKRGGDPFSRAHAMARFVRHIRADSRSPLFFIDPEKLAAFELIQDNNGNDDRDWVDEQVVSRVVV